MEIKEGILLKINHRRKGIFMGRATKNFDTEKEEFYPIKVAQIKSVKGMNTEWEMLDEIPCRNSLCEIEVIKE